MQSRWPMLVLVAAGLYAPGLAAQDWEETRIPFEKEVKVNFKSVPMDVGIAAPVVIATVPDASRLRITQFTARCDTAVGTTSLGPFTLSITTSGRSESTVSHWFPAVPHGKNGLLNVLSANGLTQVPLKLWAATSPTHIYASGGAQVTVGTSLKGYADLGTTTPPFCHVTISGYLVTPTP